MIILNGNHRWGCMRQPDIAYIFSINVSSFVVAYTDAQIPKQWDPVLPTTNSNIVMSRLAGKADQHNRLSTSSRLTSTTDYPHHQC